MNPTPLELLDTMLGHLGYAKDRHAPRVIVDVEHYRTMRQDAFLRDIRALAEQVRQTGRPVQLEPMNSYDRRMVHSAFKDDPQIETSSPPDDARLKRVTLAKRR